MIFSDTSFIPIVSQPIKDVVVIVVTVVVIIVGRWSQKPKGVAVFELASAFWLYFFMLAQSW